MFDPQLISAWLALRWPHLRDRDRGDVPGWVMVTVMTAILVVAILGVFKSQITNAVTHAIDSVSSKS